MIHPKELIPGRIYHMMGRNDVTDPFLVLEKPIISNQSGQYEIKILTNTDSRKVYFSDHRQIEEI